MSQYVTMKPSTGLTLMRVNNETWKNVSHIKNENLLIIRGKTLHHEKVMVIFQGLTLKSLDSTSVFCLLTMDPNLCSLVIIFSTSRMIVLRRDRAASHKRTHALERSGQSTVLVSESSLGWIITTSITTSMQMTQIYLRPIIESRLMEKKVFTFTKIKTIFLRSFSLHVPCCSKCR